MPRYALAISLAALLPTLAHAQRTQQCAQMAQQKLPGLNMEIVKAEWRAAAAATAAQPPAPPRPALPAYCYVEGMLDKRTGAEGKSYGIRFALSLPDTWNNNFLMQGGGGLNGTLGLPTGSQATGGNSALSRGFAVASTDTGHQAAGGGGFDGSFMSDQQAALDFEYIAIGRVADLSKQLVATYYGAAAKHSYFIGCSTGGREAMLMTQRYPTYFDGVVAGAPAQRTGYSNLADKYITVLLNAVAPRDDAGKPLTAQALSATDKKLVIDSILKACDEKDGIKDGMIFNTRGCDFDPESLACKGTKDDTCLTAAQAAAIKKGFAGPKNARGQAIYAGWLYDTGNAATVGIPGLLNPGPSPVGAPTTQTTMDVDAEAAVVASNALAIIGDSATWTNLNTFSGRGGKLIFYHGNSDPWFSALDTLGYYDRMSEASGGSSKVNEWSRVFLVPGMGHCQGGTGALDTFDMLAPLTRWVEQGQAPDSVIATGRAFPGRSRPLCAHPKHAQYKGSGDPQDAANFSCSE